MHLSAPIFRLKRKAKQIARQDDVPLHVALDQVAVSEGFSAWSHLSSELSKSRPALDVFSVLSDGELALLAARPGHGKTLLALDILLEAVRAGRHGFFFTLDYHVGDVAARFRDLGAPPAVVPDRLVIDTSDDIHAAYIRDRLIDAPKGSVVVIDYLQLLDQKRTHPDLAEQVQQLKSMAQELDAMVIALSQVDRTFDMTARALPGPEDIRMPNPIDMSVFSTTCFLHDGKMEIREMPR